MTRRNEASAVVTRRPVCTTPSLYPPAPGVCGGCGNDLDLHAVKGPDARNRAVQVAMWKVMIALGGPHEAMARGPSMLQAPQFRAHMAACGIDWAHTGTPQIETVWVFDDSEHGNSPEAMLAAQLRCLCGSYNVCVSVTDLSLGELMWHAAHIDDDTTGRTT